MAGRRGAHRVSVHGSVVERSPPIDVWGRAKTRSENAGPGRRKQGQMGGGRQGEFHVRKPPHAGIIHACATSGRRAAMWHLEL
jgi:hypothetical protein